MNRLVRVAITLFAAASILSFVVLQRLERARGMVGRSAESELQVAYLGIGVTAAMLIGGLVLIGLAIAKSRKKKGP